MKAKHPAVLLTMLLLVPSPIGFTAGSSSGGGDMPASRSDLAPPERSSESQYKSALKQKEKAWKFEAKAAAATDDKDREKNLVKAQKAYQKAIKGQTKALKTYSRNYKAANELGYALRKTGDYEKAIGAYNYALQINPDYHQAIEYRGEAFLALGYHEHAKQAYLQLFRDDRELAAQLMSAIETWLADETNAANDTTDLAAWVEERKSLAEVTQDLTSKSRSW
ncbi:MAG: tetratricopeptide repeat protein [Proteobacteria bacterium]|nr:tetratricopeptide repeat protein [Pseudomonadota bacterium]